MLIHLVTNIYYKCGCSGFLTVAVWSAHTVMLPLWADQTTTVKSPEQPHL